VVVVANDLNYNNLACNLDEFVLSSNYMNELINSVETWCALQRKRWNSWPL